MAAQPRVLDARYTHTGTYSEWLTKVKHEGAVGKWLQSNCRRYFTIDFDHQFVIYAHSETNKQVSLPINFRDIVGAHLESETKAPGLRRSFSGVGLARKPGSGDFAFVLETRERRIRLLAERETSAADWVAMLSSAHRIGKGAEDRGPGPSREPSAPSKKALEALAAAVQSSTEEASQQSTSEGSSSQAGDAWSDPGEAGSSPQAAAGTPWGEIVASMQGSEEAQQESDDRVSARCDPVAHGTPRVETEGFAARSWGGDSPSPRSCVGDSAAAPALQAAVEISEAKVEAVAAESDPRRPPKLLQAADFGFDEDTPDIDDDEEEETREPSPVATPCNLAAANAASAPRVLDETAREEDDNSDDEVVADPQQASRVAADLLLVARKVAATDSGRTSHRGAHATEPNAPRSKGKRAKKSPVSASGISEEEERAARIAADLLLVQKSLTKAAPVRRAAAAN